MAILFMLAAMEFAEWQTSLLSAFALPDLVFTLPLLIGRVLVWISVVLTMISGFQYVWGYRQCFTAEK